MEAGELGREQLLEMMENSMEPLSQAIIELLDEGEGDPQELALAYMRWAIPASLLAHQLVATGEQPEGLQKIVISGPRVDQHLSMYISKPEREHLTRLAEAWMEARQDSIILLDNLA